VRQGRLIGGVATGLARNLGVDVTLVRLGFVLLVFAKGLGALIYLVLWIIMPDEEMIESDPSESMRANVEDIAGQAQRVGERVTSSLGSNGGNPRLQTFLGVGLMGLGALFIAQQLGLLTMFSSMGSLLVPLALIAIGVALLARRARGE
jgi:phage shock protein PspC (stress-responsive transcriptional regulator)